MALIIRVGFVFIYIYISSRFMYSKITDDYFGYRLKIFWIFFTRDPNF